MHIFYIVLLFGYTRYNNRKDVLPTMSDSQPSPGDLFESMKDKDKTWIQNRYGYFVLLSNFDTELLDRYFSRTEIESVFKISKEYLGLLPLSKWTDSRVRGKILHDVIDLIIYMQMRKSVNRAEQSMAVAIVRTQSMMCSITEKAGSLSRPPIIGGLPIFMF